MEISKIPMLSRFDTISHIMPYYEHTHKAFQLISSLCLTSRLKIDEFYDEFIKCMQENCIKINCLYNIETLLLPLDLFIMDIRVRNQTDIDGFIKLINNLKEFKGHYFNSHYMHSQLKIDGCIKIDISQIDKLYLYINDLKSIQVRQSDHLDEAISLDIILKLLNIIYS